MPFVEVMYRCNTHYCFSVFRNRIVVLLTTLAVLQLFMFSFYLNGLHGNVGDDIELSRSDSPTGNSFMPLDANRQENEILPLQQTPLRDDEKKVFTVDKKSSYSQGNEDSSPLDKTKRPTTSSNSNIFHVAMRLADMIPKQNNKNAGNLVNGVSLFSKLLNDHGKTNGNVNMFGQLGKTFLKNALDSSANNDASFKIMATAAELLTNQNKPEQQAMAKIGFNLLRNALKNRMTKFGQVQTVQQEDDDDEETPVVGEKSDSVSTDQGDRNRSESKQTPGDFLAKFGTHFLTNGLDQSDALPVLNGVLRTASQFMSQDPMNKDILKSPVGSNLAKSGITLLTNALGNSKLEPKMMLNMAAKMFQDRATDQMAMDILGKVFNNDLTHSSPMTPNEVIQRFKDSESIYLKYVNYTLSQTQSKAGSPVDIDFKFLLEENDVCSRQLTSIIFVVSSANNYERRQVARQTWINDLRALTSTSRVLFIIGEINDPHLQRIIQQESQVHHDIIQVNRMETSENLALKTIALLSWAFRTCPKITHILKCEDDVFINAQFMLQVMETNKNTSNLYGTLVAINYPVEDESNKYHVSRELWPWDTYPPFILGGSYLVGREAIPKLLNAAQVTPVFALEDIHITGLCATAGQVIRVGLRGFFKETTTEELDVCTFENFASWRTMGKDDMLKTWKFMKNLKNSGRQCNETRECAFTFNNVCASLT